MTDVKEGGVLVEGKTKVVYSLPDQPDQVLLQSKDRITAGDGARSHDLVGKAAISTKTTVAIFELLDMAGIQTHFVRQHSESAFVARKCEMVPIEWVARRVATGSFLRRHAGVKEGFRFCPPKLETFFKDDANNDPQWSPEQLMSAGLTVGGMRIGKDECAVMGQTTVTVFEILEKCWMSLDCSLIDMKVEFGVDSASGELLLADVIDCDSWRLWPSGDRRLMKDKQVYRELQNVTPEALDTVKRNFEWVAERVELLSPKPRARAVVIMGSPSDMDHSEEIRVHCQKFGVLCELRVVSAHKATDVCLSMLHEYEGLGCGTVLSPESAALCAARILALSDNVVWAKLRAVKLNTQLGLIAADRKVREVHQPF